MRRTIFFILVFLIVLAGLFIVVYKIVDWQKVLIGVAALFPFGQALHKKLAKIDEEFAKRRKEEAEFQNRMAQRRESIERELNQLQKTIEILDKKYEILEKQQSTILQAIEKMPRKKKIELFRESFGD